MSNVGQIVTGVVGAAIGIAFPVIGLAYGAGLGLLVGNVLFPTKLPDQSGPRLDDLTVTLSDYGNAIPRIYGTYRVAGNIIWATPLEEVSKTKKQGGKGGGGQKTTTYSYFSTLAVAIAGREIASVKRIWANKKIIYDSSSADIPAPIDHGDYISVAPNGTMPYDNLRIYKGTATQPADPDIQADMGVDSTPAYRHTAYVLFDRLALADFGNSIPNLEFEVEADTEIRVGDVVLDIGLVAGVEISGAVWLDDVLKGYAIGGQTSASAALVPLALAFDFDLVEEYAQIRAIPRPRGLVATIPESDLAASSPGGVIPDLMPLVRALEKSQAAVVNVNYADPAFDYQTVTQTVRRTSIASDLVRDVELAIALDGSEARQIATRVMWGEEGERVSAIITLSDKWKTLRTGETVALPVPGGYLPFRLTQALRGQDGTTQYSVVVDDAAAYINGLSGVQPRPTGNELIVSQPTEWATLDAPLLQAEDSRTAFYWALSAPGRWRGATFERSTDGTNYSLVSGDSVMTAIADANTSLGDGSAEIWDEVNTLDVELLTDNVELESASEEDVLNGANAAWLGPASGAATGEIIQWRTATLIAPLTYRLSGLLRGRLGTEFATSLHAAGEKFVLLIPDVVFQADFGSPDWNQVRFYKAVSRLSDESLVTPRAFTNTGEAARPRSPVQVEGTRDVSNNLTVDWVPRSRIPTTGLAALVPLGESVEAYEVDIKTGPTVVRTIAAATPTMTYSAADQATDGLTPGDPVEMEIFMLSDIRGRGHPAEATV